MGDDDTPDDPEFQAAIAAADRGDFGPLNALAERERLRVNEAFREATWLQWARAVRADLDSTEDPHRRRVLERRRQVRMLRDAEHTLRVAVEQWPVLRRDAFPPGEPVDRAFAALKSVTLAMEAASDEMTLALMGTVPQGRKAKAHQVAQRACLDAQGDFPTLGAWLARDQKRMHRNAVEAEGEARLARGHHVEDADVDELIVRELVADGVPEDQAIAATIDDPDHETAAKALRRRKDARRQWVKRSTGRFLPHLRFPFGRRR